MKKQVVNNEWTLQRKEITNTPSSTSKVSCLVSALQTEGYEPVALNSAPAFVFNQTLCQQ